MKEKYIREIETCTTAKEIEAVLFRAVVDENLPDDDYAEIYEIASDKAQEM